MAAAETRRLLGMFAASNIMLSHTDVAQNSSWASSS